jgi:probable HAF family extracellular repeat protein
MLSLQAAPPTRTREGNMKYRILTYMTAVTVFAALAAPSRLAAQDQQEHDKNQTHYSIKNLGNPLGGTGTTAAGINENGMVVGDGDLAGDAIEHAIMWRNEEATDLGTLGGLNSAAGPVNERGLLTGNAQTSAVDPLGENWGLLFFCSKYPCQGYQDLVRAFAWRDDVITALPTLGGNNAIPGFTDSVNNRGQVVGFAENNIHDPNCIPPQVLDYEAVIWGPKKGEIHELSPLPGDSIGGALGINDHGQVVGASGSCASPSFSLPSHAVLWQNGTVTYLGGFGGVMSNFAFAINNRGQVVGQSDLGGDAASHAFLWEDGAMTDLGTLPGDFSSAAQSINSKGQVVGQSCDQSGNCRAFLWQNSVMTDLNGLIPPGSSLYLFYPTHINDRGEIVGSAFDQNTGGTPAFLAVPCDEEHADNEGCKDTVVRGDTSERPKVALPENVRKQLQQRRGFGRFAAGLTRRQ